MRIKKILAAGPKTVNSEKVAAKLIDCLVICRRFTASKKIPSEIFGFEVLGALFTATSPLGVQQLYEATSEPGVSFLTYRNYIRILADVAMIEIMPSPVKRSQKHITLTAQGKEDIRLLAERLLNILFD